VKRNPVRGSWLLVCRIAACLVFAALPASGQSPTATGLASLQGTVRDSQHRPLPGVTVDLRGEDGRTIASAQTDAGGVYRFAALVSGNYSLHAEIPQIGEAVTQAALAKGEAKTIDLTLAVASGHAEKASPQGSALGAPEFFDQPQFTVAGVTDTTTLGGHGSTVDVHNRETLAKEAAALGKNEPKNPQPATQHGNENALREAAERAPADFAANFNFGRLLADQGQAKEALPYLQRATQLKDDAEVRHLLGGVEEKLGDPLEAVREYQGAAELDPSDPNLFDWGSELLLHRAAAPAIEVFTKGVQLFPQSIRMQVGLGAAQYANGATTDAIRTICAVSDRNPADPTPYLFLGRIQADENIAFDQVVAELHRFVELQPENAFANYYYAVGLWKQRRNAPEAGDFMEIEALLRKAVQIDPTISDAWLLWGILRAEQKDWLGAISDYKKAIESGPKSEQAHYRLAQAYQRSGDSLPAQKEIEIYQELSQQSAAQEDRERHEIKRFVYTLRQQPQASQ
jgi:tetratricopeptide (TPR) repeat protein